VLVDNEMIILEFVHLFTLDGI